MKKSLFLIPLTALLLLASCDDGTIEEKEAAYSTGKIVKVEGQVTGLNTWPAHYNVAIAGFTEQANNEPSPYATISKVLTTDAQGNVSIVLSAITGNVKDVELCVLNSLRQRVMTFASEDISSATDDDTIRINFGTVDVSALAAIQVGLFNVSCIGCHGSNGFSGGGLNLTEGHAYASLVNLPSTKVPEKNRVTPGDAANSVLYEVINDSTFTETWRENHKDILNKDRTAELIYLVKEWINSGAKN